jgi:2-polyprenyl-3-methyl-5-hydroxy-6-metoxy-1,4-benzoquinol methylase
MNVQSRYQQPVEDQRQFFDELITQEWETYRSDAWDYSRRFEVERILRTVQPRTVLDIGCGCGFHDVEFARHDFVTRVDAIDYSRESIKKANEEYPHAKVARRVGDLLAEQPEPTYDLVVSFQVFEHLSDPASYFRYAIQACRPGGALAIVTPNRDRLDNRLRRWRGQHPVMVDPQHFHEYSISELSALGERFGLRPIDSFGYGLQSLIAPALTPRDYRRVTRWGALVPRLASVIGVLFEKPHQAR